MDDENGAADDRPGAPAHFEVAIVGSGFAGLGMAIRLREEGIEDFVVLERAGDVGGTWRDNTYPGIACDVPSHLYSFSFAPNPGWSRTFSPGSEIWDYLRVCARRYGVMPHVRFDHEVTGAGWDEEAQLWRIETSQGPLTANLLVAGMGGLSEPAVPAIPGIGSFEGTIFHSARWQHDHDLAGERVAVIGTGASAIQFVPRIQPEVGRLHLFQRTPPWVVPHRDRPISERERRAFRALPQLQLLVRAAVYWARETFVLAFMHRPLAKLPERIARRHLEAQVPDPELRARLTPSYTIGCKRVLISDDYYPALSRPNVELVTDGIREVRERSIVTEDGAEHEIDTIVFGTGFHVVDMPATKLLRGRDGKLLDEVWQGSPQAHLGTTIAGFPNLFMLVGPNTGLGHNSIVFMIESQIAYVLDCLRFMRRHGVRTIDVRPEVQEAFNAEIQERLQGTVWNAGGCASWYLDDNGRNTTLWPGFTWPFRQRLRRFEPAQHVLGMREPAPEAVAA
jgi:cation diffusion facilitator CzcD-associated flavoprotein CzcO